jgi:hypothetical protein
MITFCIQIQPHRCPEFDLAGVLSQCERLSTEQNWVKRLSPKHGFDEHAYVNLMFETDYPKLLWKLLYEELYRSSAVGQFMRAASIATCEGRHGWDDYLLRHHFDDGVNCDLFPE